MALAHVQTVQAAIANNTSVTTTGITTTSGNLIVIGCGSWKATAGSLVITDSKVGNTWLENPAGPKDPDGSTRIHQFYCPNIVGGASHTFTATGAAGSYITIFVSEFSGAALSSVLDKSAGDIGSSAQSSSGITATRIQADEVLVGISGTNDLTPITWTEGTNFTIPTNGSHTSSSEYTSAVEYQIVNSAGTDAAIFNLTSSVPWAAIIGTYKMASASSRFWLMGPLP